MGRADDYVKPTKHPNRFALDSDTSEFEQWWLEIILLAVRICGLSNR